MWETSHLHHYTVIVKRFILERKVIAAREFGNGNINKTYLVSTNINEEEQIVLQRINTHDFKQPKLITQNMPAFTEHMRRRASENR